jgi:hypothetical protein
MFPDRCGSVVGADRSSVRIGRRCGIGIGVRMTARCARRYATPPGRIGGSAIAACMFSCGGMAMC